MQIEDVQNRAIHYLAEVVEIQKKWELHQVSFFIKEF
jgi:hypothetical protein